MRRMLCAVIVLGLLVAGCTKKPEPVPTESPTPSETPSPEPPPIAALTGEELDTAIDHPVLAVKIDNASAALPPDGLEAADIVFEEEVEGGLTRFLALFHSDDPDEIGPVRSGREVDADLLPQFQPVLAFSGAANPVKGLLRDADIRFFEEGEPDDETFFRVDDRLAPHNLFAKTDQLWEAGEGLPAPDEPVFFFEEEEPDDGQRTGSVHIEYSTFANADWSWKARDGQWERRQNGSPHVNADGNVLTADNVVILRIKTTAGNRRDSAGNPTVELKVIGNGQAIVLRDGKRFRARWSKEAADEPIELETTDGDPLALRPGTTWIQLLDLKGSLAFRKKPVKTGE